MKNSIAENHLSKHGRFGDTEIANTSTGELWHVNKHEKKLIDDYGTVGERLVDISGSGTINPTTGLKEQWVQAALMAASMASQIGLSLYKGSKQSSMERESNREKAKLTESQLEELKRSRGLLGESTKSQLDLITEQSIIDKEKLSKKMKDIGESISQTESKIGFSYSGDIENAKSESIADVRKVEEGLMAKYGAKVGDVLGLFESEKARIKSERERLESEKKLYESMSKPKFLGIF